MYIEIRLKSCSCLSDKHFEGYIFNKKGGLMSEYKVKNKVPLTRFLFKKESASKYRVKNQKTSKQKEKRFGLYFKDDVDRIDPAIPFVKSCLSNKCRKRAEKLGFCKTHYMWFKEGLLKKDGTKPKDFDKKYFQYMKRVS